LQGRGAAREYPFDVGEFETGHAFPSGGHAHVGQVFHRAVALNGVQGEPSAVDVRRSVGDEADFDQCKSADTVSRISFSGCSRHSMAPASRPFTTILPADRATAAGKSPA